MGEFLFKKVFEFVSNLGLFKLLIKVDFLFLHKTRIAKFFAKTVLASLQALQKSLKVLQSFLQFFVADSLEEENNWSAHRCTNRVIRQQTQLVQIILIEFES